MTALIAASLGLLFIRVTRLSLRADIGKFDIALSGAAGIGFVVYALVLILNGS